MKFCYNYYVDKLVICMERKKERLRLAKEVALI